MAAFDRCEEITGNSLGADLGRARFGESAIPKALARMEKRSRQTKWTTIG